MIVTRDAGSSKRRMSWASTQAMPAQQVPNTAIAGMRVTAIIRMAAVHRKTLDTTMLLSDRRCNSRGIERAAATAPACTPLLSDELASGTEGSGMMRRPTKNGPEGQPAGTVTPKPAGDEKRMVAAKVIKQTPVKEGVRYEIAPAQDLPRDARFAVGLDGSARGVQGDLPADEFIEYKSHFGEYRRDR